MIEPAPQTQGELPHRALDDPLKMSVAEKLACEWEARHDVAARGRILSPAPVQHYMTHTRCEDNRHAASSHPSHEHPQPESGERFEVLPLLRGWLSWEKDVR
jgi:hypothetical protein